MTLATTLEVLTALDAMAIAFFGAAWMLTGWRIEHPSERRPSVTVLMAEYRREWMRQMVTRQPRIFDATIMATLRQGTAFFASTSILAIGGVLALVGNTDPLTGVAADLATEGIPALVWQLKLLPVILLLTNGFLKFVWSNRLFGYCSVVMAAVPNDIEDPLAYPRAAKAAEINIRAAWNFNRGLRSMYFALASLAWLIGPIALAIATSLTVWTLMSREFGSSSRRILIADG